MPLNAFADALSKADRHLQQYLPEYFAGFAKGIAGLGPLVTVQETSEFFKNSEVS